MTLVQNLAIFSDDAQLHSVQRVSTGRQFGSVLAMLRGLGLTPFEKQVTLLARGVAVEYFDHHHAGPIPRHPLLHANIDPAADTCTSMIVDTQLGGRFWRWAVAGAFGDNLAARARRLASQCGLGPTDTTRLQELGENVNYNAYGEDEHDVLVPPADLYAALSKYEDPLEFIGDCPEVALIAHARRQDMERACATRPFVSSAHATIYRLPDTPWASRVRGAFANWLATTAPDRANIVAKHKKDGAWHVSVRAPLSAPYGADRLCRHFGGDGRAGAAAISGLPDHRFDAFITACLRGLKSEGEHSDGSGPR
ncbi:MULTISPECIES: acetyltransferase [unclassified Caballeronia]|uniref:acetyltransferase n=1 Tax=unclassified Caballeronia TaxID=2646786 RepID=UPI002027C0DD|nr:MULTISPECIES: acetyltransferase [unclassified Caballeronia]